MKLDELVCQHTVWTWIQNNTPMSKKELASLSHRYFNILYNFNFYIKRCIQHVDLVSVENVGFPYMLKRNKIS